jgi:hypothetical protein
MTKKLALYLAIFIVSIYLFDHYSIDYSFGDFKEYTTSLLAVSGMVFTIMGIWIAFLYPNALNRIVDPDKIKTADFSSTLQETKRLEAIVGSVLKSAVIVLCVSQLLLAKIIFYETAFYELNAGLIKTIALSFVTALSYVQLEAVGQVAFANIMFLNDLHNKRESREADNDF